MENAIFQWTWSDFIQSESRIFQPKFNLTQYQTDGYKWNFQMPSRLLTFLCRYFMAVSFSVSWMKKNGTNVKVSCWKVMDLWFALKKKRATHQHIIIFHLILLNISRLQCKVTTHYHQFPLLLSECSIGTSCTNCDLDAILLWKTVGKECFQNAICIMLYVVCCALADFPNIK